VTLDQSPQIQGQFIDSPTMMVAPRFVFTSLLGSLDAQPVRHRTLAGALDSPNGGSLSALLPSSGLPVVGSLVSYGFERGERHATNQPGTLVPASMLGSNGWTPALS
jgi:hypothetical protein